MAEVKNSNELNGNSIRLSDVMCPVCLSILIEPVTMPCQHELCMPCFQQNVQKTSLSCPICRSRISSWKRKATRENNLVNTERWDQIRRLYPKQVKDRLSGKECIITLEGTSFELI
ncbi:RNF168 (predicted) [Pycnogonum litorale]